MTKKKSRLRKWILLFFVTAVVLAVGVAYSQMSAGPPLIDESSLAKVERANLARSVVATGVVEPISNRIEIRSKASGMVKELYVDVGDRVREGQELLELDRDQLLAQLRESEANLTAARADLLAAQAELERNKILAEEYDVALAKTNHERSIELFEQNLVSKSDYDLTKGRLEEALNRQRAAAATIGVTRAAIAQKEAQVAQVQAVVERIQEELRYTTIRSPVDGIVLARRVEVGSAVSSILTMGSGSTTVMILGDMNAVYVKGKVNESDIGMVQTGLPARITVEAYKGRVFNGQVYKIAPLGEEEDNVTSFEVRVSVENPEGLLLANMSANSEIILEEHENTLTVPEGAIIYDTERQPFVEVPDSSQTDGKRRVSCEVGISTGTKAEILSGLQEGDQVILQ